MKNFKFYPASLFLIGAFVVFAFAQESPKAIREADELMGRGDLKGAIAVLDKAVEKRKDLFEAYKMRAQFYFFSGELNRSIADLDSAIEIKPEAELYAQRAEFKTFLRDENGAMSDYNYAIAHGYKTEKAYQGRAMLKRNVGNLDGAIEDYRVAVGMNPDFAQALVGLASTLDQKGDTDAGIIILQDFLDRYEQKRDGKLPTSKMNPTGQSVSIKDEKSATEDVQISLVGQMVKSTVAAETREEAEKQMKTQERVMNVSMAYANLAQMLERKGDYDKALANVNKSISIHKGDFYSTGLRGKILLGKGELDAALIDLNSAIRMMPSVAAPYADRGIVLLLTGKDAEAQKDFDKFLQIAPKAAERLNKRIEQAKQKRSEQS